MPIIAAKCTQCGGQIEVDSLKEAGVCLHCGTAFITEKVINHYNTVNNTANYDQRTIVKHIYGKEQNEAEDYIKNGNVFLSLNEYGKAEAAYRSAIDFAPGNWQGWFGLVKLKTKSFSDSTDIKHLDFLQKARAVASGEDKKKIEQLYEDYRKACESRRLHNIENIKDRIAESRKGMDTSIDEGKPWEEKLIEIDERINKKKKRPVTIKQLFGIICALAIGVLATIANAKLAHTKNIVAIIVMVVMYCGIPVAIIFAVAKKSQGKDLGMLELKRAEIAEELQPIQNRVSEYRNQILMAEADLAGETDILSKFRPV